MDISHSFSGWKKRCMIPGFIEGLEKLSFGDRHFVHTSHSVWRWWCGDVIPPNTDMFFEIELWKQCLNNQIDL
jgi:peptidylprolyl isomerase